MGRKAKPTPRKWCKACGKRMERKRINGRLEDLAVFRRRVYCDRDCMAKGMEREVCRHPSSSRAKAARTAKDACEACGATGRLHVHHLDENPLNNAPSNLRTLCPRCHRRSHSPNFMADGVTPVPCKHCEKPSKKKGLCFTHLTRLKKYGDPLLTKVKRGSVYVLVRDGSA